jgi:RNA polymerase-interacting CarD/CdnL/TRCF family regulator
MTQIKPKIGSFMVDAYDIYKITAIKDQPDKKGKDETFIFYGPVVPSGNNQEVYSSIPLANLSRANLRPPLTIDQVKLFFKALSKKTSDFLYSFNTAKDLVYKNDPELLIPLLHHLWANQHALTKSEIEFMDDIFTHLVAEISFITKKKPESIKDKLHRLLNATVTVVPSLKK